MILNLGVDFGTSSTKVFCRNLAARRDQQLSVLWFGDKANQVSAPSTIRIQDGRVWFGHRAEILTGGQVFRSLKVCVACSEGAIACRCVSDGCSVERSGDLAIDSPETRELVSARELCTILVAGLLHEATEIARKNVGAEKIEALLVNVAAPLDQVAHDPLGDVFQEVLGRATALRGKIVNGMPWKEARWHYRNVIAKPLPSKENRTFGFFPEAVAAIHAYSESPVADEGLYALVDVGAGTTAVSYFRVGHRDQARRIAFYASHTEIVGADDMDMALSVALQKKYPTERAESFDSRSPVRHAKEMSADGGITIGAFVLTSAEAATALKPVFDRIFTVYQKGARAAYVMEQGTDRWAKLTLILVGGGSLVPGLPARLLEPPQTFIADLQIQHLALPAEIAATRGQSLPVTLLAVGFGLSFVAADIPEFWHPSEVGPFRPDPLDPANPIDRWGEDQV